MPMRVLFGRTGADSAGCPDGPAPDGPAPDGPAPDGPGCPWKPVGTCHWGGGGRASPSGAGSGAGLPLTSEGMFHGSFRSSLDTQWR